MVRRFGWRGCLAVLISVGLVSFALAQSAAVQDADAAYDAGDYATAKADYMLAVTENPADTHSWLRLGELYARDAEWTEAARAYEVYLFYQPDDNDAKLKFGMALIEAGDLEKAEAQFNELLHDNPESIDATIGLAKVEGKAGNVEEALTMLDELSLKPDAYGRARVAMAFVYLANGYLSDARAIIAEELARDPENVEAQELKVRIVAMEKEEYLSSAKELPSDPYERAEALFARGDYEAAKREYERVIRDNPQNTMSWMRLGTMYRWEEDWEGALDAYTQYLSDQPYDYEVRLRYAQVLLYSGDAEGSRDELNSLINDTDCPIEVYEEALWNYATALNATGEREQALMWYEEALMLQPHNLEVRTAYAGSLSALHRFDEAEIQYMQVLDEDPTYEPAKLGLGRSYSWSGNQEEAAKYFGQVSQGGGQYNSALVGQGYSQLWSGDRAGAQAAAAEALRINPDNPDAQALQEQLDTVPPANVNVNYRQTHDSDDNDYRGVTATISVPLDPEGNALVVEHEQFKLDNSNESATGVITEANVEESDGTRTKLGANVRLSDDASLVAYGEYVEVDNTYPAAAATAIELIPGAVPSAAPQQVNLTSSPTNDHFNYGADVKVWLDHDFAVHGGYSNFMLYGTPTLAQTAVTVKETALGAEVRLMDGEAGAALDYSAGDYSDGNGRDEWALNIWRQFRMQDQGTMRAGLRARQYGFDEDLNNGYFDPSKYRTSELYLDWVDLSQRALKFDASAGWGIEKQASVSSTGVFHWNLGVRYSEPGSPLEVRTGYYSSDAASSTGGGSGYEYSAWYFNVGYKL